MRALIFPFQRAEGLAPLRALSPDFLIPMAGKPFVEHLLEQLAAVGIREVTLLCDDRPDEVGSYFGNGERWGCTLTVARVREAGGLRRMTRAALHGAAGSVVCLPGNLAVTPGLTGFLARCAPPGGAGAPAVTPCGTACAVAGAPLARLAGAASFATLEELMVAASRGGLLPAAAASSLPLRPVRDLAGFLVTQREILGGELAGSRIPGRLAAEGVWIGNHCEIAATVRLVAPVLIGSHCRISGQGQVGPNAVVSSYCYVNGSDLICDSLIMPGTVSGRHTELNGVAARGGRLVNLRSGAVVTVPDPFILGDLAGRKGERTGSPGARLLTALLLLLFLAPALPLILFCACCPGACRSERRLGNRRRKTLGGENPRLPFTLRQLGFGPLLLRRSPGLLAVLAGDLALVGAAAIREEEAYGHASASIFGMDVARGLLQIWEVEGEPPESGDEQSARENFHAVTRTLPGDLVVVLKAALTSPARGYPDSEADSPRPRRGRHVSAP